MTFLKFWTLQTNMSSKIFFIRYLDFEKKLNNLSILYILRYFKNANIRLGNSYHKDQLSASLNINKKYIKFLDYMLSILQQEQEVIIEDNYVKFFNEHHYLEEEILQKKEALQKGFPEFIDLLNLVTHCAVSYSSVLSGEASGVSVVYPSADINFLQPVVKQVEKIYRIHYQCRVLEALLKTLSKGKKISILEIGGGVGQITWKILPRLAAEKIEYLFTDISRFFIVKAKERAKEAQISFMDFKQYDISKDPLDQGFQLESFDVILALNVIHAVPDLISTLTNLKKLLQPNGMLFIVEHVTLPIWANMAWGVLEGWWSFNDPIRQMLPTLEPDHWLEALKMVGFSNIRVFPKENSPVKIPLSYIGILASAL
ncbi:MAG: polyketide synthase [Gammaproteobacteria bacterium]|jgi:SAM-dependent methyltransferase|nr:polyketide synthase [Gammaproteobacteria bacterium]